MRTSYTLIEAERLVEQGQARQFEKSIVLLTPHYPEFLWDEQFGIYKLTCFVPLQEIEKDDLH